MTPLEISRRDFLGVAAAGALLPSTFLPRTALTAQHVVDRIQKSLSAAPAKTVDGLKAGLLETTVTGIATTSMATLTSLQKAVASGKNMVLTYEPTFYGQTDAIGNRAEDPVYVAKKNFIDQHKLVIWRFHDQWLSRTPDPVLQGLTETLGWQKNRASETSNRFTIPATTIGGVTSDLQKKLSARAMRIVGNPQTKVTKVALLPGLNALAIALKTLPDVDLIIAGEMREWEGVEYAQDTVTAGKQKGLILVGRVLSEEPAMRVCAQWLKTMVREVPVDWIPVGDPYWRVS